VNFENKFQTSIKSTIKYIKYLGMSGAAEVELTTRPVSSVLAEITMTDRPTIIILGENHFYNPDTFTVISKIIEDTVKKFGVEKVAIYTEAPEEQLSILERSPNLTDYHILKLQNKYHLGFVASAVTLAERKAHGLADDRYVRDILDVFRRFKSYPKQCLIVCVGLIHSVEIFNRIPDAFDKHVYNVCGFDTLSNMVKISFAVVDGHVTNELYLSLRRLPIIVNDDAHPAPAPLPAGEGAGAARQATAAPSRRRGGRRRSRQAAPRRARPIRNGASQSGGSNRKSKKRKIIKKKSKKNNKRK
jgi:hypothetical protein